MNTKSYILAGIIAAITMGNAYATGENTVTSKSYVDARDELKQNKIPATGTNASTPGDTVVTYTSTAGTIGERGIFDGDALFNPEDNMDDLVTAGAVIPRLDNVSNQVGYINTTMNNISNSMNTQITNINNQMNAETRETISVQLPLTCANSCEGLSGKNLDACEEAAGAAGGCTLWEIGSVGVAHKLYSCTAQTVASCPSCGTGTQKACENNICTCNACNGYNISASSASQCCSGYLRSGQNKCGCSTNAECAAWELAQGGACEYGSVCNTSTHTCGCATGEGVGQ